MPTELKPYTVILVRPAVIQDPALYNDTYLGLVMAEGPQKAIYLAQDDIYAIDGNEVEFFAAYDLQPYDYTVIAVFEGHHRPVHSGN